MLIELQAGTVAMPRTASPTRITYAHISRTVHVLSCPSLAVTPCAVCTSCFYSVASCMGLSCMPRVPLAAKLHTYTNTLVSHAATVTDVPTPTSPPEASALFVCPCAMRSVSCEQPNTTSCCSCVHVSASAPSASDEKPLQKLISRYSRHP